jgi:hypothetical protein
MADRPARSGPMPTQHHAPATAGPGGQDFGAAQMLAMGVPQGVAPVQKKAVAGAGRSGALDVHEDRLLRQQAGRAATSSRLALQPPAATFSPSEPSQSGPPPPRGPSPASGGLQDAA